MSFRIHRGLAAAALAVLAVAAVGCGETVIDDKKAEETLQASLEKSIPQFREKITSVDCPSDVKVEAGKTFTCQVNLPKGEQATATLKIRNKDADISIVRLNPSN